MSDSNQARALGVREAAAALRITPRKLKVLISAEILPPADASREVSFALWCFSRGWVDAAIIALRANPRAVAEARYGKRVIYIEPPPGIRTRDS